MDQAWRWRRPREDPPAHPGAAPAYDSHDPRDSWRMLPREAFTEDRAELDRGYPPCTARHDDVRPSSAPRYTAPESAQASVTNGTTTAPFLTFSGVPDHVVLDPGTDECVFTFRDDAGRIVGTLALSAGGAGPFPIRCKRVDVTNNGAAASVVSVSGYYDPARRGGPALATDYVPMRAEASAGTPSA